MKKLLIPFLAILLLTGCQAPQSEEKPLKDDKKEVTIIDKTKEENKENVAVTEDLSFDTYKWAASKNITLIKNLSYDRDKRMAILGYQDEVLKLFVVDQRTKEQVYSIDLYDYDCYIPLEASDDCIIIDERFSTRGTTFLLSGESVASSPGGKLIIEDQGKTYKVLFNQEIENFLVLDVDQNGVNELYGLTTYGGQVFYDIGFSEVFAFNGDVYESSYELTRQLEEEELKKAMDALKQDPTIDTLNYAIKMNAYLGDKSTCDKLMIEYKVLVDNNSDLLSMENDRSYDYYFTRYEMMAEEYSKRWLREKYGVILAKIQKANQFDDFKRTMEVMDIDGDGDYEMLVNYSIVEYTDVLETFIIDTVDGKDVVTQVPSLHAYYVEYQELVQMENTKLLYEQITNGPYPLGCRVFRYDNGNIEEVFYQASATGSGYYSINDTDEDGIYDTIVSALSDYGVFHHRISSFYEWDQEAFVLNNVHYGLDEVATSPEELIYQFFDLRWLEKNYGRNDQIVSRYDQYVDDKSVFQLDLSPIIDGMFGYDGIDTDSQLEIKKINENGVTVFNVSIKHDSSIKGCKVIVSEGPEFKIKSISLDE